MRRTSLAEIAGSTVEQLPAERRGYFSTDWCWSVSAGPESVEGVLGTPGGVKPETDIGTTAKVPKETRPTTMPVCLQGLAFERDTNRNAV